MIEFQAMFPVMVADNLAELKQYYEENFGFNAVFFEADFYLHLVSPDSGVQLGFLMPNLKNQPSFLHSKMITEGYAVSLDVADAHKAYQQAQHLKLDIQLPLTEEVWGQRHFILQDPAGFYIDIVEHLEDAEK